MNHRQKNSNALIHVKKRAFFGIIYVRVLVSTELLNLTKNNSTYAMIIEF